MPRVLVLDSFPLSCVGKRQSATRTATDLCRDWVLACLRAGHRVHVPAICYYETLRELERLNAGAQIARLQAFTFAEENRFLPLQTAHLEAGARLWAQARRTGQPTSAEKALDGDVLLAAQAQSLSLNPQQYVVATANVKHLARFVPAEQWTNIAPGS